MDIKVNQIKRIKLIYKALLFSPLLIYLGKRSLLAYDEGIYALQAKWIINSNNWIAPMWWGEISLDRTIGVQALIALSQKILGTSNFYIYVPNIIASFLMLFFTYQLHKQLVDKEFPIASPLILATTYLWINFSHQASQDMIFSTFITFGIFSTVKYTRTKKNFYLFSCGLWIGLAFMLKTYLTLIPLIAIMPVYFYTKITKKRIFWLGIAFGFIPFLVWSFYVISDYNFSTYTGLFSKLISLSKTNTFSNPIYYYLWNIPLNIFPWTFFTIVGLISSFKNKRFLERYFLFFYPIFIVILISSFSTKTSYYPLQISTLLALNSYVGIFEILRSKKIFFNITKFFNLLLIPFFLIFFSIYINYSKSLILSDQKIITLGILIFSISWISANFIKSRRKKLLIVLLGPYLMTCIFVQTGTLSDRNQELRIASEKVINQEFLKTKKVQVIKGNINSNFSHSQIIKISLFMPNIGNGLNNLEELQINEYAWTTEPSNQIKEKNKYQIVDDSDIFKPWKLVMKEK